MNSKLEAMLKILSTVALISIAISSCGPKTVIAYIATPPSTEAQETFNPTDDPNLILRPSTTVDEEEDSMLVNDDRGAAMRFCKSDRFPQASSRFPKEGKCIDGKIFARFPDSNKQIELKPGYYAHTVTGSTCSFTIGRHCDIK